MPTYQITSPQGETFEITTPAGVTSEEVTRQLLPHFGGQSPAGEALPLQPAPPPIPDVIAPQIRQTPRSTTPLQAAQGATLAELMRLKTGAQVLGNMAMGDFPAAAGRRQELADIGTEQEERAEQFPKASFAGSLAPYMALPTAAVSTLPRAAATGAAIGGIGSGGDPLQAGMGALGGGAGYGIGRLLAKPFSPSQQAQTLMSEGIQPSVGQGIRQDMLGSVISKAEEASQSIPIIGSMATRARRRAMDELNQVALNRAMPSGRKLPDDVPVRDALNIIRDETSQGYDRIFGENVFNMSAKDIRGLQAALEDKRILAPKEARDEVLGQITQLMTLGRTGERGFKGDAVKFVQSQLRNNARAYTKSQTPKDREIGKLYQQADRQLSKWIRSNLDDEGKKRIRDLDRAYANYIRVERAASMLGAEEGRFTPAQLQNAVKATAGGVRGSQFARGSALMQDLSEPGKTALGGKLPESGTTPRLLNALALGGVAGGSYLTPAMWPIAAALPLAAGGATRPAQKFMLGGYPGQDAFSRFLAPMTGKIGIGY